MKSAGMIISVLALFALMAPALPRAEEEASAPAAVTLEEGVARDVGLDMIYEKSAEGYRKRDAQLVASLYTEDAIYLAPGSEMIKGRSAIEERFTRFFTTARQEKFELEVTFRILARGMAGTMGYDVGVFTLEKRSEGKAPKVTQGSYTSVTRRDQDGVWRFHVDSYSTIDRSSEKSKAAVKQVGKKAKAVTKDPN